MANERFTPGTKYAARVRSGPDQAMYWGEWSTWSSEVHWSTELVEEGESAQHGGTHLDVQLASLLAAQLAELCHPDMFSRAGLTSMYGLAKVFVPVCVLAPLLLLCAAYVKM